MKAFWRKTIRSAYERVARWMTRKRKLVRRHPARAAGYLLRCLVVQLVSVMLSFFIMSVLLVFAPTFAFFRGFSFQLNLQNITLPTEFVQRVKEQLLRFSHPQEVVQCLNNLPRDIRQALGRGVDFLATHLQDGWQFLKERHTLREWCDKLVLRPLQNHPRIVRETIGFLLAILVAHLLEPMAAPVVQSILTMSEDGLLPHASLLTFLGINFTAILAIFLGAGIRSTSNAIGEFLGNYFTRCYRKHYPQSMPRK